MKSKNICEKPGHNNLILLESLILRLIFLSFSTCLIFLTFPSNLTNEVTEKQVNKYIWNMLCMLAVAGMEV